MAITIKLSRFGYDYTLRTNTNTLRIEYDGEKVVSVTAIEQMLSHRQTYLRRVKQSLLDGGSQHVETIEWLCDLCEQQAYHIKKNLTIVSVCTSSFRGECVTVTLTYQPGIKGSDVPIITYRVQDRHNGEQSYSITVNDKCDVLGYLSSVSHRIKHHDEATQTAFCSAFMQALGELYPYLIFT